MLRILRSTLGEKCHICGATRNLLIHHKDENPDNNVLSNLTVVCKKCHRKIHIDSNLHKGLHFSVSRNFNVRFPEDLLTWLDEEARKARRSRNELLKIILEDLRAGRLTRTAETEVATPTPTLRRAY